MSRILRIAAVVLAFACSLAHAQSNDFPDIPSSALAAYKQGLAAEGKQQYDIALERFQASLKLAGRCLDCMEAIARTQVAMSDDKGALATASKMAAAATLPREKAHALAFIGGIYYSQSTAYADGHGAYEKNAGRSVDALKRAEASFAAAVAAEPGNEPLMMRHAQTLAALKRDEEASKEFVACAAVPGTSPTECARVLRLSRNLDVARHELAPSFDAVTLDGKKVSLDSLSGKVVLVDFWGTWCPYCVRDGDYVQSLLDSFPADRFVLLEVDSGDEEDTWKTYVADNRMQGVQARDEKNRLQSLFHVGGFPTYIILDGDGAIRERFVGAKGDLRGAIRKLIAEQPDAQGTKLTLGN